MTLYDIGVENVEAFRRNLEKSGFRLRRNTMGVGPEGYFIDDSFKLWFPQLGYLRTEEGVVHTYNDQKVNRLPKFTERYIETHIDKESP